ncbi:hypothetical protein ACH5RR_001284 [Cinchona calisaya]|uniref:Uncharacterized protein n=1 Tax=Cinchona calisaya TaxID=153742 RepID=A0ABD3B3S2_9GENT
MVVVAHDEWWWWNPKFGDVVSSGTRFGEAVVVEMCLDFGERYPACRSQSGKVEEIIQALPSLCCPKSGEEDRLRRIVDQKGTFTTKYTIKLITGAIVEVEWNHLLWEVKFGTSDYGKEEALVILEKGLSLLSPLPRLFTDPQTLTPKTRNATSSPVSPTVRPVKEPKPETSNLLGSLSRLSLKTLV